VLRHLPEGRRRCRLHRQSASGRGNTVTRWFIRMTVADRRRSSAHGGSVTGAGGNTVPGKNVGSVRAVDIGLTTEATGPGKRDVYSECSHGTGTRSETTGYGARHHIEVTTHHPSSLLLHRQHGPVYMSGAGKRDPDAVTVRPSTRLPCSQSKLADRVDGRPHRNVSHLLHPHLRERDRFLRFQQKPADV
jgi:hypothetical protein